MWRNERLGSLSSSGIDDVARASGPADVAAPDAFAAYAGFHREVSPPLVRPRMRGGLSPRVSRRVREYIEAHLDERIENRTLAELAELSVYHFVRAFKQSHGVPPRQ